MKLSKSLLLILTFSLMTVSVYRNDSFGARLLNSGMNVPAVFQGVIKVQGNLVDRMIEQPEFGLLLLFNSRPDTKNLRIGYLAFQIRMQDF